MPECWGQRRNRSAGSLPSALSRQFWAIWARLGSTWSGRCWLTGRYLDELTSRRRRVLDFPGCFPSLSEILDLAGGEVPALWRREDAPADLDGRRTRDGDNLDCHPRPFGPNACRSTLTATSRTVTSALVTASSRKSNFSCTRRGHLGVTPGWAS